MSAKRQITIGRSGGASSRRRSGASSDRRSHPGDAGTSGATVAGWFVEDVSAVVDDLTASGVAFERYDGPSLKTDEKGVAVVGDSKAAWFKDPDGNVLGLLQD
jgi:hypothetical protein